MGVERACICHEHRPVCDCEPEQELAWALEEASWRPHARALAEHSPLTEDEIMEVWRRHPLWAPRLPSSPVRGILMRLRRYIGV